MLGYVIPTLILLTVFASCFPAIFLGTFAPTHLLPTSTSSPLKIALFCANSSFQTKMRSDLCSILFFTDYALPLVPLISSLSIHHIFKLLPLSYHTSISRLPIGGLPNVLLSLLLISVSRVILNPALHPLNYVHRLRLFASFVLRPSCSTLLLIRLFAAAAYSAAYSPLPTWARTTKSHTPASSSNK